MFSLTTKIAVGIALAAVMACAVLGWQLKRSWQAEARAIADRDTAVAANVSLVKEAATAKAEAIRNATISATALRENKALDEKVAAIRERLRNGQACRIDPADADALDGLFR